MGFSSDFYMTIYPALMIVWGVGAAVVHVTLMIAVWSSRPPRRVLLPKWLWAVVVLFGGVTAAAIYWVLHYGLMVRTDRGTCNTCGYDRTGLAASAVCPECGAAPVSK